MKIDWVVCEFEQMVNWRVVRTFCAAVFFYRKHHVKRFSCLISCGFKSLLIVRILETGVIFANFDELSDISVKFSFVSPVSFSFLALNFKRCTILHQLLKFEENCWILISLALRNKDKYLRKIAKPGFTWKSSLQFTVFTCFALL